MSRLLRSALVFTTLGLFAGSTVSATIYTSAQSGNFTDNSTWVGGTPPVSSSNNPDTVIISTGHNVVLDQDYQMNLSSNLLQVDGTLSTTSARTLILSLTSKLAVAGTLNIDSLSTVNNDFNISGQATVRAMRCMSVNATGGGDLTVTGHMYLFVRFTNTVGQSLTLGSNSVLHMLSGELQATGTGTLNLNNTYDVIYSGGAHTVPTGPELQGSGLRHVTVDLAATDELLLGDNVNIANGDLTLQNGTLNLNSKDLSFTNNGNLAATGSGMLKSAQLSTVTVANNNGLSGALTFVSGGNTLSMLTLNTANGATTELGSTLRITNSVAFQKGSLDLKGYKLSLITGATVSGADASKYFITSGAGSLSSDIGAGSSFTYHVGTATEYAPCTITAKNNTVYNGLAVRIAPGVTNLAANQPRVNATWYFESNNGTIDVDAALMWGAGLEANQFDRSKAYISRFLINYWDRANGKSATTGSNGLYSLTRTGINSFTPLTVFDNNTVDVQNIETDAAITLYPNPVGDVLHIGNLTQAAQVTIYNAAGAVVIRQQADKSNNTINTASLPAGTYFLQLKGEGVDASGRITKQ